MKKIKFLLLQLCLCAVSCLYAVNSTAKNWTIKEGSTTAQTNRGGYISTVLAQNSFDASGQWHCQLASSDIRPNKRYDGSYNQTMVINALSNQTFRGEGVTTNAIGQHAFVFSGQWRVDHTQQGMELFFSGTTQDHVWGQVPHLVGGVVTSPNTLVHNGISEGNVGGIVTKEQINVLCQR